jgi:hypothetical protein
LYYKCLTQVVIVFANIKEISCKPAPFAWSIQIVADTGLTVILLLTQHVFKVAMKSEKIYGIITTLWKNANSEAPMPTQDLIDHIGFIYGDSAAARTSVSGPSKLNSTGSGARSNPQLCQSGMFLLIKTVGPYQLE